MSADKDDVLAVVNRVFVGTDAHDWPAVRACFAPSVRFDMTSLAGGQSTHLTPEQITAGWETGLRPIEQVHHQTGNDCRTMDMRAKRLTPILNVSDITESFVWFEKLGWKKGWDWGDPPTFGGVCSGQCEIFLCQGAQGGRGNGGVKMTFGPDGDETSDKGVWMSIWVDDVDAIHRQCVEQGLDVAWPPTDMPWGVREMHVRHPDGHVFRISKGIEDAEEA